MERNDAGAGIVMRNVGVRREKPDEVGWQLLERMERIEKLLETINLRLSAMGGAWKPSDEIR